MSGILLILLIIAVVKSIVFGVLLFVVFRDDIRQYFSEQKAEKHSSAVAPACVYCESTSLRAAGEPETRWERDELVLVTGYECLDCGFPFWHVERVTTVPAGR